jgi:sugar/nucleoside kinase (ribokinase family)
VRDDWIVRSRGGSGMNSWCVAAAHKHGLPLAACLNAGCAAGAQVVQTLGAQLSEGVAGVADHF